MRQDLASYEMLLIVVTFLLNAFAFSQLLRESVSLSNNTIGNSNITSCNIASSTTTGIPPLLPSEYQCVAVYPIDITVVNSRYPDYDADHLHQSKDYFMLRRQYGGDGEIATRVQFQGLPSNTINQTCRLEFMLPDPRLQRIQGLNPSFNVYQVERAAGAVATWNTYVGYHDDAEVFGIVNGDAAALNRTRSVGGVAAVNATACNETLTFQMGMRYDGPELPNYWAFLNIEPPGWPVQGFRVVHGC